MTFTLTDINDFVILKPTEPFTNISSITVINEVNYTSTGTVSKEFRWAKDEFTFSSWIPLTLQNLNDNISFPNFFIEFKYTLTTAGSVSIDSVNLSGTTSTSTESCLPFPIAYQTEKGNRALPIRLKNFKWNPYKMSNAVNLQKDLSYIVNQMGGHEVTYFKTTPKKRSEDVIFLEWTLYNVEDPECIKVMVPDNQFPDMKFNYNMFGIDFEMPFEVHIDKRYFDTIYGPNSKPAKRDIIHFSNTNRMYKVESVTLQTGFMNNQLYWKVNLAKYDQNTNLIFETDNTKNIIDNLTTGIQEILGEDIKKEREDIVNQQQLDYKYLISHRLVSYIIEETMIKNYTLSSQSTIISKNYYDINSIYNRDLKFKIINGVQSNQLDDIQTALKYGVKNTITSTKNLVYTSWFLLPDVSLKSYSVTKIEILPNSVLKVYLSGTPKLKYAINEYIELSSDVTSNLVLFGKISKVNSNSIEFVCEVDTTQLQTKLNVDNTVKEAFTLTNTTQANLLKSLSGGKGLSISIIGNRSLKLILNDTQYNIPLTPFIRSKWYSIVFSLSNTHKQLSIHFYSLDTNNELPLHSRLIQRLSTTMDIANDTNYEIQLGQLLLTNVRILNQPIEEDKHRMFISQELIKDASNASIIDNAIPVLSLPYMGAVK